MELKRQPRNKPIHICIYKLGIYDSWHHISEGKVHGLGTTGNCHGKKNKIGFLSHTIHKNQFLIE